MHWRLSPWAGPAATGWHVKTPSTKRRMTDLFQDTPLFHETEGNPRPENATGGFFVTRDRKKIRYGLFAAVTRPMRGTVVLLSELGALSCTTLLLVNALLPAPRLWLIYLVAAGAVSADAMQRPSLDAMLPRSARGAASALPPLPPRRMVAICSSLGFHTPFLFPEQAGANYEAPPYLKVLEPLRGNLTVFSGISHPGVDGGHSAEMSFLTAAPNPGAPNFKNSISLDQLMAERIGVEIPDRVPQGVASARAHEKRLLTDPDLRLDRDAEQVRLDREYLERMSLAFDLRILAATALQAFTGKGVRH